jgi:NADH-quinone oxidoreductase subunit L
VGSGAYTAAIFHMVTHAFFKALLFLGSGAVIHGMHDEQDMRYMGALRKAMPVTAATFIVGWLAIAGVPPFAGFWSKDDILLAAYDKNKALWVIGLVTALLTAYYMTRQVIMVFYGKARWNDRHEEHGAHGDVHPHESPAIMLLPLVVLAGLSIIGGGINLPFSHTTEKLAAWLEPVVGGHESLTAKVPMAIIATASGVIGIVLAFLVYAQRRLRAVEPTVLARGWYYDWAISRFMGGPGRRSFDAVAWYDANVVDGAVNGAGKLVRGSAQKIRPAQSGNVRNYAAGLSLAVVLLLVWFVVVRGNL